MARHSCDKTLKNMYPNHAQAQDGERWVCTCGLAYEHVCDEAEGCRWTLFPLARRVGKEMRSLSRKQEEPHGI